MNKVTVSAEDTEIKVSNFQLSAESMNFLLGALICGRCGHGRQLDGRHHHSVVHQAAAKQLLRNSQILFRKILSVNNERFQHCDLV